MKEFIVISLILVSIGLQAQDTENTLSEKSESGFYFGAYFSPDFADIKLKSTDGSQTSLDIIESRKEMETFKFAYTTGLTIAYSLTDNISIESGFVYSNKGYKTNIDDLNFGDNIDPRRGIIYSSSTSEDLLKAKFIDNYHYIGIPIVFNYSIGKGKLRFSSNIGCTPEFLVGAGSTLVLYYEDDKTERIKKKSVKDWKEFNISLSIGAGVDYKISPKMWLSAIPTFRYGVLPIKDAPITGYLYSGGIEFGWYMEL